MSTDKTLNLIQKYIPIFIYLILGDKFLINCSYVKRRNILPIYRTKIRQNACLCSGLVPKSNIHCVENLPRSLETGHFLLVCDNSFVSETTGDLTITKVTLAIFYPVHIGIFLYVQQIFVCW